MLYGWGGGQCRRFNIAQCICRKKVVRFGNNEKGVWGLGSPKGKGEVGTSNKYGLGGRKGGGAGGGGGRREEGGGGVGEKGGVVAWGRGGEWGGSWRGGLSGGGGVGRRGLRLKP